jgi:hypothetical protein
MRYATYSPEDNKLRLYPGTRLPAEEYERVKALGFKWAPRQELFFAPMWTPEREDLLIEMCGEIEDEDVSLADRAEQRAERFAAYSESRKADADRADKAVKAICEHIPLGQPILVGHHSEKRARKDAERIDSGMRRMVQMWETAEYWHRRAAGALAAAKYKELPAVRARRIKKLEAELRKIEKSKAGAQRHVARWRKPDLTIEEARIIAGMGHAAVVKVGNLTYTAWDVLQPDGERYAACPAMTVDQVRTIIFEKFDRSMPKLDRWIAHYTNRIAYEKAMLGETGYIEPPKAPTKAVLPLLNYRRDSYALRNPWRNEEDLVLPVMEMTKEEFADINKDYNGTRISKDGTHRVRTVYWRGSLAVAFLTDSKVHPEPGAGPIDCDEAEKVAARVSKAQERIERERAARAAALSHNKAVTDAVRGEAPKPGMERSPAPESARFS